MASRQVEDIHQSRIDKLLSASGFECIRSVEESLESSTASEDHEAPVTVEEEKEPVQEEIVIEEEKPPPEEQSVEELPLIFPTPSLRLGLSDKTRKILEHNRIHTLPEDFKTNIDPAEIPRIAYTAQQRYIEILADLVGCKKYKSSLAEYWFLDTMANLLHRAQEDGLSKPTQAVLMLWFCEWMKEMQHFDAADRKRMIRRFQDNMLSAARYIGKNERIPTPLEAKVRYKTDEDLKGSDTPVLNKESRHSVTFRGAAYECSLRDLTMILHYIFDLFSTDYQYNLVRSIFTFTPEYTLIDNPYQLQMPRRMYAPLKIKPKKEKSPKKEKPQKGKKKIEDTAEYLALMEFKAREDREIEERLDREREEWNLRSHIVPLNAATTDELFDKYWPPPPPEPEPEVAPEPKKKGKKK